MCEAAMGTVMVCWVLMIGAIVGLVLFLPAYVLRLHEAVGVSPEAMGKFIVALSLVGVALYWGWGWLR